MDGMIQSVTERTKEFAILSGVQMRCAETPGSSELIHHGPFTLFPSKVPRRILQQAIDAQRDFNVMMHKVAYDLEFLHQCLCNVIRVDEFTRNLWDIYTKVTGEGTPQPVCLGLFRNDFMMDTGGQEIIDLDQLLLKQIEFNTIAASFGGLVSKLRDVHRYALTLADIDFDEENMPVNDPAMNLGKGLVKAWELYGKKQAYVLFIVGEVERNRMDQVLLEKAIFTLNPDCRVLYRSFNEVDREGDLNQEKELLVDGKEISVVYYRSGYMPDQYNSQQDWDTRLKIERSRAIKCPTVGYQLAGTKKVQQELCRTGCVELFLTDPEAVSRVRQTFVGQYTLDKGPVGNDIIRKASAEPHNYVIKPQREGGGNNVYDSDIPPFFEKIKDTEERAAYIVMDRIHPLIQKNYLIAKGQELLLRNVVNEIGIYGVLLGSETDIIENFEAGHLVRTKNEDANEGGVVVGFSVLDTPYLISTVDQGWKL